MKISTRGRYSIRFILDLAEHVAEGYIPMKEVAERQSISPKYLEQILPILIKAKLIESSHGKGGGYKLTRKPKEYSVGEILRLTEGDLAPVACLGCDAAECERSENCKTLPMWKKFDEMTNHYFDNISVLDLINETV